MTKSPKLFLMLLVFMQDQKSLEISTIFFWLSQKILTLKNLLINLIYFCFFRNCVVQSISGWKWNISGLSLSSHGGWRKPRRLADCSTRASARWRKFFQTVWLKSDLNSIWRPKSKFVAAIIIGKHNLKLPNFHFKPTDIMKAYIFSQNLRSYWGCWG